MRHPRVVDRDTQMLGEEATATFSPCRTYRYALTRSWDTGKPTAAFVMLNPSTADAVTVDPTIRRCLSFARAWGCGGLLVVNLFALRSTDPRALRGHPNPVGPDNDAVITDLLAEHGVSPIVAAWGVHGTHLNRSEYVSELLTARGVRLSCLGLSKHGHPKHPLYLPASASLVEYPDLREDDHA